MSTYTDLHNRVKETLTVDYHSRVTPQVISALNQENEFWGKFRGSFSGDVQISSLSGVAVFDSDFVRGRQLSSTMDSPRLFLSVDEESGEDVVQDLTAYIAEHGSAGISSVISGVTLLDSLLAGCSISADGAVSSLVDYIKAHDDGDLARAISAWLDGRFALSAGVLSAKDDALAANALSVSFSRVCDLDNVPLSGLLRDLQDKDTVLDVCVRVNDIISLAGLGAAPLDFETCSCEDLFTAVRQIADDESIVLFSDAVEGLNSALRRLGMANRSLESRLSFLMRRIDDVIVLANKLSSDLSRDIATGDAAVLAEVRLSADEFRKAAKSAEERVDGRITKEVSRASAAEGVLSKRIAQIELSAVTAPELEAESAERIAADGAISAALTAEAEAREAAVGGLGVRIEALSNGLSGYYQRTETSSAAQLCSEFEKYMLSTDIESRLADKWSKDDDIFSDHGIASKTGIGVLATPAVKAFAAAPAPEYAVQVVSSGIIVKQEYSIGFPLKNGTMTLDSDFAGKVALSTISEVEGALGLGDLAKKDSVGAADLELGLSASISSRALDASAALSVQSLSDEIYGGFVKYADVSGGKSAVTAGNPIVTRADLSGGISALCAVTYADLSARTIGISSLSASSVSACFSRVVDADDHSLSDCLKELPSDVTVFGVCVRTNDIIRFAGRKDVSELPYDTARIEDTFDTVRRLTGEDVHDFESVRAALNASLSAGLGPEARTLSGQIGILMGRDEGIAAKVDALSAEIAKGGVWSAVSADIKAEIGAKADASSLTAYALSADVMSRETAAGRFDGVNGRIDGVLAKLKAVYSALSGLPSNPADFNLIENVAPALIALRSALSAFA